MSDDKDRFSARVEPETLEMLDEYKERRGLTRSQAVDRVVEQWADLTDGGEVHPELVKAKTQSEHRLLESLNNQKTVYAIAALLAWLVYDFVALPALAGGVILFFAFSWAVATGVGHTVAASRYVRSRVGGPTADDIEVEA